VFERAIAGDGGGARATGTEEASLKMLNGKRVLVVEDDPDTLEVLRSWAENLGCTVLTARSGEEAVELIPSFKPRVLITDYVLEDDLTGVDLIVHAGKRGMQMICVLVTAMLNKALRESLDRIHGVIILAKPVDLGRLSRIIASS
jgi:CheY-like chemotaxis protein